jgi:hypothetical protein
MRQSIAVDLGQGCVGVVGPKQVVDGALPRAVALPPDQALVVGRGDLAVMLEQPAVGWGLGLDLSHPAVLHIPPVTWASRRDFTERLPAVGIE